MTEAPIAVVEDDAAIADLVELYLSRDGHRVLRATGGDEALALIAAERPGLVILDVGLAAGPDGFDVCRRVRDEPTTAGTAIILLTARGDEADLVAGLELGADDYLTKPFSPRELMARVRAVLRRAPSDVGPIATWRIGGIEVVAARREVYVDGDAVALTVREFDLLLYLARHAGIVLNRRQLLDGVWGVGWVGDERTVDVHVRLLRRKLGAGLSLATVWGIGYRLD